MNRLRKTLGDEFNRLVLIAVLVFLLMTALRPSSFLSKANIVSMAFQIPEMGILTLAITFAFITGGMDLSLVGISNLSAICAGLFISNSLDGTESGFVVVLMIAVSILISLLIGVVCGAFNGFLISKMRINPILATLGSMQLYSGIAMILTQGSSVVGLPEEYAFFGQSSLLGIPVPLIIFILCATVVHYQLSKTRFGIKLKLIGTNEVAAKYSGIDVAVSKIRSYVCGGVLAAIAGIVMMSRVNSAKADFASSYIMQTILIAILGGVSPSGGKGTVKGVFIAACILQFLSSGFNMMRMSQYAKELVWGALLIAMISIMVFGERKEST